MSPINYLDHEVSFGTAGGVGGGGLDQDLGGFAQETANNIGRYGRSVQAGPDQSWMTTPTDLLAKSPLATCGARMNRALSPNLRSSCP